MTDRLTRFRCNGEIGYGIVKFAHTRSGAYTYRPSLPQHEPAR